MFIINYVSLFIMYGFDINSFNLLIIRTSRYMRRETCNHDFPINVALLSNYFNLSKGCVLDFAVSDKTATL